MDYQTKGPARASRRRVDAQFPFPDDIVNFIHRKFPAEDITKVYQALNDWNIIDPRAVRCVLLLTDGRSSMLEHYCQHAAEDLLKVIEWAETVDQVSTEPMRVRDLRHPFGHDVMPKRSPLQFAESLSE